MKPTQVISAHFKDKTIKEVDTKAANVLRFIFTDDTWVELETVPVVHTSFGSIHGFEATAGKL